MENQNRLQIKQRQLQIRLSVAGAELRRIAGRSESQVLALGKKTEQFSKLKAELKNSKLVAPAAHNMQKAQSLRTRLQKNAREMQQASASLNDLQNKAKQHLQNIKLIKEKVELIDEKLHLRLKQEAQLNASREQEDIAEIKSISQVNNLQPYSNENLPAVDGEARLLDGQTVFMQSRQDVLLNYAESSSTEQAKDPQVWQNLNPLEVWQNFDGGSGVELTFQAQDGERLELSVNSDLHDNIDISLASGSERHSRQLWRQKADLLDELKQAGVKVENFNIIRRKEA